MRRSFLAVFKVPGSIMTDRSVCARFEANEDNAFARFDAMSFTANLGLSTWGTLVASSARGESRPGAMPIVQQARQLLANFLLRANGQ